MPLITPKTDWIAGDSVGFSDMNRIEGNILYLQNENKTINGTNTYTGASTFNSSLEVIGLTTISSSGITSSSASIDLLKPFSDIADSTGTIALFQNTNANGFGALFNTTVNTTGSEYIIEARASSTTRFKVMANGRSIFGGGTDNETDLLQAGSDSDISVSLGRGKLGYFGAGSENEFAIAHYDMFNTTDYAFYQNPNGLTIVNAKLNQTVRIRNNNTDTATFSGSQIDFLEKVTLSGESTFSVDFSGDREFLLIRARDSISNGAGINLYGSADSLNPDKIKLFADNGVSIEGGGLKTDNQFLKTKVVEIGTWNMSSGGGGSTSKSVAHGLTRSKIRKVKIVIVNDSATTTYPLEYVPFSETSSTTAIPEGSLNVTATNVVMRIRSGGWWNAGTNTEFDGTQNRGYIEIDYEA